ncbi:hypothetical protein CONPUDRAFT_161499 [Coniophora puteana RWD-64-598 SS2]|uniref:Uncharacterized protein n=1 Tax=Coniophora puteana (strain RWD-64-598) TaxID=741705 RepID=A0A5M3N6C7_CONPW|nr:uncharacterized protein CONPUDRAFT_161499 [Coniophora puteana RWD-64-598 SS2]EIW86866.1 hypothetical protein CONPUDRAFT_161499 [Coniophora puteana RWD-64-598 SS2]
MSVAPTPSAFRGQAIVQPSYFTSSLYVDPLTQDINSLCDEFAQRYAHEQPTQPFSLFKDVWDSQGWPWMHFKVFDDRTRHLFLRVTMRLFLDKTASSEPPLHKAVSLFGLYMFYSTQPSSSAPPIKAVDRLPIPSDTFTSLLTLDAAFATDGLTPLQPYVVHVVQSLIDARLFEIAPPSHLHALNPRTLPREIFVRESTQDEPPTAVVPAEQPARKKRGRPSKREMLRKAKESIATLDKMVNEPSGVAPPQLSRQSYASRKAMLLSSLTDPSEDSSGETALGRANAAVLDRMRKIDEEAAAKGLEVGSEGGDRTGLGRVERAAGRVGVVLADGTRSGGVLSLLEGAGMGGLDE